MAIETERKFLLASDAWRREAVTPPKRLVQGYFPRVAGGPTVRVRISGAKGFLTVKGRPRDDAPVSRSEFEYVIPAEEAESMLEEFCSDRIVKKLRYIFPADDGLRWEIDEYLELNAGLFTAEIELPGPDTPFPRPPWLGKDISGDPRYTNAALSCCPYSSWRNGK